MAGRRLQIEVHNKIRGSLKYKLELNARLETDEQVILRNLPTGSAVAEGDEGEQA